MNWNSKTSSRFFGILLVIPVILITLSESRVQTGVPVSPVISVKQLNELAVDPKATSQAILVASKNVILATKLDGRGVSDIKHLTYLI
jgi:hypothetical protein